MRKNIYHHCQLDTIIQKFKTAPGKFALSMLLAGSAALASNVAFAGPIMYELSTTLPGMTAWAMNEKGQIAGWNNNDSVARIYNPGTGISIIPLPEGARSTIGYTMNEAGQVAGRLYGPPAYDESGRWVDYGFIYTSGANPSVKTTMGSIGFNSVLDENGNIVKLASPTPTYATGSIVTAVNGNYTTGYSSFSGDSGNGRAWRHNPDGTFTEVSPLLGTPESQAYGMNSSGTVVGRAIGQYGNGLNAFVFNNSIGALKLFDVTDPKSLIGWSSFLSAQDITEDGRITGWGVYSSPGSGYYGSISGFVLTPVRDVSEPGSVAVKSRLVINPFNE